jgi:hypothetical protein
MESLPFILVVTGGRRFDRPEAVFAPLDSLHSKHPRLFLFVGDCPGGVDLLAWRWATERGVTRRRFNAQWRRFGLAAGPRRNREMVRAAVETPAEGRGVAVFPGGRGTGSRCGRCTPVIYRSGTGDNFPGLSGLFP